ncbi:MAG: metal-dependent hydrolase [Gammaproteobacteria bacterium]|nr:metal-dependent hydrolase [Gammaproteobacteria bacterium]
MMAMKDDETRRTSRRKYHYEPKEVDEIIVRPFAFEFPDDLDPVWVPGNNARSHLFNGLSLTMPYLEPYLIKTNQEASAFISEPELLDDMRAFNGQEARHYQCHRRLNELLKANGYPELAGVEARLAASYDRLSKKSLRTRLAYSAGFESMTNGFTHWLINRRRQLFAGASPHVSSFWLMHMVEETEHKTVAFDAYMAYSGQYLPRAIGVFHGSFHVVGFGVIGMLTALKKDGKLYHPKCIAAIIREIFGVIRNVGPYLLRALLPWHNPRCEDDPQWMKDWIAGHAALPSDALLPLVDTDHPDIPVPFTRLQAD